jgi:hypothetical protein
LAGKHLSLLKEIIPDFSRAGILKSDDYDPGNFAAYIQEAEASAKALKVQLQVPTVRGAGEFASAFATFQQDRAQGILVLRSPVVFTHIKTVAALGLKHRVPTICDSFLASEGGLMTYGVNWSEVTRSAADITDKIFRGAKASEIPIQQPTTFWLAINLKTAKGLGDTSLPVDECPVAIEGDDVERTHRYLADAAADGISLDPAGVLRVLFDTRPASEAPEYRTYREILTDAAVRVGGRLGWTISRERLPESLPRWMPFPDTNPALKRLSQAGYALSILSNVDDDLLSGTLRHLEVGFSLLITAQQVRSYKPAPGHFATARGRIGPQRWLHAAQSTTSRRPSRIAFRWPGSTGRASG